LPEAAEFKRRWSFDYAQRWSAQFRMESFNFSNLAREGIDERQFRFGLRVGF